MSNDLTPTPAAGEHDGLREAVERIEIALRRFVLDQLPYKQSGFTDPASCGHSRSIGLDLSPDEGWTCQDCGIYKGWPDVPAHPVPSDTKEEREGCNVLGPREATSRCVLWPDHVPPHQDSAGGEWPYAEPEPAAHPVPAVPEEERECACGHDKTDHRDEVGCIVKVAPSNRVVSPFCRCLRFAAQPSVPAPAPERCPESWVPAAGGPGHQCVKPAGHAGAHDSTPAPERVGCGARIPTEHPHISFWCVLPLMHDGEHSQYDIPEITAAPVPAPEDEQREALAEWVDPDATYVRAEGCAVFSKCFTSDELREHDARVWDEGYEAFAVQFVQPLDEAGQRPKATNPYREAGEGRGE